jgi:natural product biosynthesis luciferase-like monooxygenase protein/amino acid adenylation domain-containing protein
VVGESGDVLTDEPKSQRGASSTEAIADWLTSALARALKCAPERIDRDSTFHALGVDSVTAVEIAGDLEVWLGRPVPLTALFEHPSITRLADALAAAAKQRGRRKPRQRQQGIDGKINGRDDAAITLAGIACRLPGAAAASAFWQLLVAGRTVAPAALANARPYCTEAASADRLPPARYLPDIDEFDPEFFGIAPSEAAAIDPQQRLLLEVAWEALEDAGIAPSRLAGSNAGVYVGIGYGGYAEQAVAARSFSRHDLNGNALSLAANRLSYALDLHGPSLAVDTSCSSALSALHLAYRDLRAGVTDLAIVGGVNLILTMQTTDALQRAGVLAADGLCKVFDRRADGYGRAEACGVVVLERAGSDARSQIAPYAVVRGCAVNQDGRSNGLTAPNRQAQQALIEAALADAGLHSDEVDYVECHGTGTSLGDPIEIAALHSAFAGGRRSGAPLYLGAVKANVGHAEAAAGMVGLIKTALALHHGAIPGTPGLRELNPKIELADVLRIATQTQPWPLTNHVRLAGVSSFGFGGSNAHAILGTPREQAARPAAGRLPLFVLSARTGSALRELARRHAAALRAQPSCELGALCRAVQIGRDTFAHRLAVNAADAQGLADCLTAFAAGNDVPHLRSAQVVGGPPAVSLLCPGEEGDYRGLVGELAQFVAFRDTLQRTEAALREADVGGHARNSAPLAAFALNVALGAFWRALGIQSDSIFGIGIGEIAAGHLAGRYDMATAVQLALRYGSYRTAKFATPDVDGPLIRLDARPLAGAAGDAVLARFTQALGELFVGGSTIAWSSLYTGLGERFTLPTYPFERQSYWHALTAPAAVAAAPPAAPDLQAQLRALVAELLRCNAGTLDGNRTLIELGADSFDLVRLVALVDERLGRKLDVEDLIEGLPSLHELSARIALKPARTVEARTPAIAVPASIREVAAESRPAVAPIEAPAEIATVLQRQIDLVSSVVTQQLELLRELHAPATARSAAAARNPTSAPADIASNCRPALGLSFFGMGGAGDGRRDYENIIALAKRADRLGLASVWLPERHFHALGGFSPNPVVLHAALARETERIALRAGSVVLPLHHPIRVAEEWSMLDNLSGGRVGLAAAAGWNADDFILAPENHADSRTRMYEALDAIRSLWRGGTYRGRNGRGAEVEVTLFPRPCQTELPVWIAVLRDPASFVEAGRRGFGVLTNLIAQTPSELAANIAAYRQARQAAGHAADGHVAVLLHTYLDDDAARARQDASAPFRHYLESAAGLFPSFVASRGGAAPLSISTAEREAVIRAAYARYVENCALIGSVETAAATMRQLGAIGVDEVAAFVDFGMPHAALERTLDRLPTLAQQMQTVSPALPQAPIRVSTKGAAGSVGASDEVLPLLPEQVPLWWAALSEPARMAAFNYLAVLEAPGGVDREAAAAALQLLLERHAALRASFGEERTQTIHAAVSTTLGEVALADEAALAIWLKEERSRPFDLSRVPLLRATIVRVGASRSYLAIAASHLVSDGTAARVILAEFAAGYEAVRRGSSPALPAPPYFTEYVRRAGAEAATAPETLAYWRKKFTTPPALCDLPADRARRAKRSFRGACHVAAIPAAERDAIEAFAKSNNATLLMVLAAGFAALVSRLAGEKDVTFGVELAGRRQPGTERLVAHCSHLALARVDCGACATFTDLVEAMRGEIVGALRHQDIPWPTLSGIAWPEPLPGRVPPVGAVINLAPPLDLAGPLQARLNLMAHAVSASQFEFALNVLRQADGLRLECFYDIDLFDGATIDLLARRLRTLLVSAVGDPARALDSLDLMDADERKRLLVDFNASRSTGDLDLPYHVLFARQVERSPGAIATLQQERRWTYAELDAHANAVAWQLIERGIEPGTIVPLLAHRRLEFLAAMLGILKAGGAVMPLSPTDPVERVGRLCGATGAKLVLVDEQLKQRWDWIALTLRVRAPVVLTLEQAFAQATDHGAPPQRSSASDLAYVIHTSGSTGMPKGAMVEHRGMVNHIFSKISDCTLGDSDVVAQVSHQCFDVMVWQMLAPLVVGGKVGIIPEPQALHPLDTMAAIEAGGITVAEMVPVFIAGMLDLVDEEPARRRMLTRLRWLIATGEALPPALCRRWFAHFPDIPILNAYGPAECSDDVATHALTRPPTESETVVPIGRPIQNARIYVLDNASRLQPIGVPGHLCVGGIAVGRGYLNDPERTDASFTRDPFGEDADARLYCTGDRGRWRADGVLEFLGRLDRQLKVNGVRVEPGEVEAAILCHPAIGQAAVQVVRDEKGGARLIAKLKARNGERPPNIELRRLLQTTLPPQLVPSEFHYLDSMPLTQTGKLDRKALDWHEPGDVQGVRWRMGEIWTEILGHRDFGDDDSFFDIGGKSFDALELVSRIRDTFRGNLSVQALLRVPTINGMAGKVEDFLAGREVTID